MGVSYREFNKFLKELNTCKELLSRQHFRTLKGQAYAGDVAGAR